MVEVKFLFRKTKILFRKTIVLGRPGRGSSFCTKTETNPPGFLCIMHNAVFSVDPSKCTITGSKIQSKFVHIDEQVFLAIVLGVWYSIIVPRARRPRVRSQEAEERSVFRGVYFDNLIGGNIMYYKDFLPYARENSGKAGEACEMCFKSYTSGRTVKKLRPAGKKDAYVTFSVEGKRRSVTVEVKTACGRIDNCCDSDYIAYWPEPEEDIELEHSMVVFSREEWRAFLEGYTGRGKILHVRKDGETHIQSFRGIMTGARPKASLPIANYIYEVCEKQPTVAEWLEALRK